MVSTQRARCPVCNPCSLLPALLLVRPYCRKPGSKAGTVRACEAPQDGPKLLRDRSGVFLRDGLAVMGIQRSDTPRIHANPETLNPCALLHPTTLWVLLRVPGFRAIPTPGRSRWGCRAMSGFRVAKPTTSEASARSNRRAAALRGDLPSPLRDPEM